MSTVAITDNFRSNLRVACDSAGMTLSELARRSGIHRVTISRIMSGHMSPTLETCEALSKAVGMRPDAAFLLPEEVSSKK